jgi:hypothetical protein
MLLYRSLQVAMNSNNWSKVEPLKKAQTRSPSIAPAAEDVTWPFMKSVQLLKKWAFD